MSKTDQVERATMAKGFYISKALAIITVVVIASAIASLIIMVIVYETQIAKLKPTPSPTSTASPTVRPAKIRLPGDLMPDRYELYLWPRLYTRIIEDPDPNITSPNQTMVFTGNSTVHFHCVKSTRTIFLHSQQELALPVVKVMNRDANKEMTVTNIKHHEDASDFLEINVYEVLVKGGNYSLFVAFEGKMNDENGIGYGLYVRKYNESVPANGSKAERFLAASQLQPLGARKIFPCFDEPAMKAKFDVTIIHRRGTTALGNSEHSESSIIDEEWMFTRFHTTMKMSTYLLAFAVSEFKSAPSKHEKVNITIYARPEAIEAGQAEYAANITGKILKYYEDYFNIEFPQKKMDQIAIPHIWAAMENWGLVVYPEISLLYEDGLSLTSLKEWNALLIAHELAHQWFGNLVTMSWWNQVWLNEGFASYMAYLAVDHVEPTWHIKEILLVRERYEMLEFDASTSHEPLSSRLDAIETAEEIEGKFDGITYAKGSAVIRMLADCMTDSVFQAGLKMYLNAFQYGNTEQKDLWEYLQKAVNETGAKIDVATMMDTWTNQIGYPLITINTTSGEIDQRHFLANQTSEYVVNGKSLVWHIPIKVMSKTSEASLVTLDKPTDQKEVFIAKAGEWVLANVNATGYFRVNYNPENWRNLITQLETNPNLIPVNNRGQLIDDAFSLSRAKLVNVTLALNSTRFLRNETASSPWESAHRHLDFFTNHFDRSEVWGPMQAYLREQVRGLYGFFRNYTDASTVPSDHSQQFNQIKAITLACTMGLPECHAMVTRKFHHWMRNDTNSSIHVDLREVIYCQAVAAGGEKEWEFVWKMYQSLKAYPDDEPHSSRERMYLLQALACTKKIWLLKRCLEYTLDPDKIRKSDIFSTIMNVNENAVGQALAWNFVREHWTSMKENNETLPLYPLYMRFSTDFELAELKRFHKDVGIDGKDVEEMVEEVQENIKWMKENKQTVLEWFQREAAHLE